MSSKSSFACCALSAGPDSAGRNGRTRSAYVRRADTDISSFSRQRKAVSRPPNAHTRTHTLPGPHKRAQPSAEDAAGVDVDRAVEPFRLGHGRVAINHAGTS